MSVSNLRRRLHHGDVDGRKNEHVDISSADALNEPLLGSSHDNGGSEVNSSDPQYLKLSSQFFLVGCIIPYYCSICTLICFFGLL